MSLGKVREVKKDKFFKPADLIIYGLIAAVLIALFTVFFAVKKNESPDGVRIYVRDEAVFEYDFGKDEYRVLNDCARVSDGEKLTVRITADGGYNVVEIDKSARSARVTESDCPSRDCVYSPPVTGSDGFICCMPHHVRIMPFGYGDDKKTVIM